MNYRTLRAVHDPAMSAKITRRLPLAYLEGSSAPADRPPFVLAASGLAMLGEHLFVVQDNANWLAVVHPDETVTALPLPRHWSGVRIFNEERQNTDQKFDLEACVVMQSADGPELVGFGSGTGESSCWILRVTGADQAIGHPSEHSGAYGAHFLDAAVFYQSLRDDAGFSGGRLNIEGATAIDAERILVLQRGDASESEGDPVDATGEVSWPALIAHLADPSSVPPPQMENVTRYELGQLNGVRLTFSDAEYLGDGRILFSGSAEKLDGSVSGSVIGLIDGARHARWTEISSEDGSPFRSKIEGLSLAAGKPGTIRFVIDDDDETAPSEMFEAVFPAICVSAEAPTTSS
jgi:hypothetical protein